MAALVRAALAALVLAASSFAALADDWVAVRLRGAVLQLVDGEWQQLKRGDVVSDSRVIRTLRMGNVEFQRGEEHVALGPDTQIQIFDKMRAKPFTTVKQHFGTVTIEAEVRDVQHFAVENRYLAAVVKGTKFTVTAGDDGASVDVRRGAVFVEDSATKNNVTVTAGQSAAVDNEHDAPTVTERNLFSFIGKLFGATPPHDDDEGAKPGKGKGKSEGVDKGRSDDPDKPGKGTPHDGKPDKDGKSNNGKSGDHDNSGKGKSGDDD